MVSRLDEVLAGKEANYLLPFLWQRGEDEAVIREEIARVDAAGIRAVCVEARPHPDFLGPRWWRDMDIIMEEARQRGMRVWVLDDDHFPTGHAAGKVVGAPLELQRLFLHEHHIDVYGPQQKAALLVEPFFKSLFNPAAEEGASLLAVIAARRPADSTDLNEELIDLTARIQDNILYWDIPAGYWRVFFLITSRSGGSAHQKDYLNPLIAESTQILLDGVYEPFYQRYPEDFGKTFAGFFSDEPGFYNDNQSFDYNAQIGKKGMPLPWRPDMLELLTAEGGADYRLRLPLLWHEGGQSTSATRFTYMNLASRLYGENFADRLGDWCRAHRVEYIGHVIEDNGAHARMGCGAGHFFRSLWGQDMSGLDIVLWQVTPGFDGPFTNVSGEGDGEFYHYGLAKLGSSLGHVDPKKQGRTMCELFGAYGWREGLKLMKWMTDHLLVRGVNYFVPHAFSQADFPDPDCPPHFFARGKNPQYRYYRPLNLYTNRISHLLSSGVHVAAAGVLYHGEAEWMGEAMPFQKPARVLMQHQLDYDVLPGDVLLSAARVDGGRLWLGQESYQALIVPACEHLPQGLLRRLAELAASGLPVLYVDRLPGGAQGRVVALADLARTVDSLVSRDVQASNFQPALRHYHTRQAGMDLYFLVNDHPYQAVQTRLRLAGNGPALVYDGFENQAARLACSSGPDGVEFELELSPYGSLLVAIGADCAAIAAAAEVSYAPGPRAYAAEQALNGSWSVATATAEEYPTFTPLRAAGGLGDISAAGELPNFAGTLRYETEFELSEAGGSLTLDLGAVYETAEVWVNGESAGLRICPPYRLEVGPLAHRGRNRLAVEVTTTLVREQRDFLSRYAHLEPSGLLGPVRILKPA